MNTEINDGGPAFPQFAMGEDYEFAPGMTIRDWFAGQIRIEPNELFEWPLLEALAGPRPEGDLKSNPLGWFEWSNKWQAEVRYAAADAMIEVRNQTKQ